MTKSSVPYPKVVKLYNNGMGGVAVMDQRTAPYRLDQKSSVRFYLHIFFDLMDIRCVNSYLIYSMKHPNKLCLVDYKIVVAKNLIQNRQGRKRAVLMSIEGKENRTFVICLACNIPLCLIKERNCFQKHHI